MVEVGEAEPIIIPNMGIPSPPILSEAGILVLDDDILCLRLGGESSNPMMAMDIPLTELMEDLTDPIVLNINGKKYLGTLSNLNGEGSLAIKINGGEVISLKEIFADEIGNSYAIHALYPNEDDKNRNEKIHPKYHILMYNSE